MNKNEIKINKNIENIFIELCERIDQYILENTEFLATSESDNFFYDILFYQIEAATLISSQLNAFLNAYEISDGYGQFYYLDEKNRRLLSCYDAKLIISLNKFIKKSNLKHYLFKKNCEIEEIYDFFESKPFTKFYKEFYINLISFENEINFTEGNYELCDLTNNIFKYTGYCHFHYDFSEMIEDCFKKIDKIVKKENKNKK